MVESAPAPEHGECSVGNPLEDHEEALRIARSVDGSGSLDHDLHVTGLALHQRLRFVFGSLVIVGWTDRGVFIRRRVFHVAMNAAGAAVQELAAAAPPRCVEHYPSSLDIHLVVEGVGNVELPECRCQMEDELRTPDTLLD